MQLVITRSKARLTGVAPFLVVDAQSSAATWLLQQEPITSAAPATQQNASTSLGGHHLQTVDKTKIKEENVKTQTKKKGVVQVTCPASKPLRAYH